MICRGYGTVYESVSTPFVGLEWTWSGEEGILMNRKRRVCMMGWAPEQRRSMFSVGDYSEARATLMWERVPTTNGTVGTANVRGI